MVVLVEANTMLIEGGKQCWWREENNAGRRKKIMLLEGAKQCW